ncbi:hypothetical protein DESC_350060 [Desulfosarcina cetonica]|nr:hypothetical protein DESC_350060 [Desulfosarcina cetonica]
MKMTLSVLLEHPGLLSGWSFVYWKDDDSLTHQASKKIDDSKGKLQLDHRIPAAFIGCRTRRIGVGIIFPMGFPNQIAELIGATGLQVQGHLKPAVFHFLHGGCRCRPCVEFTHQKSLRRPIADRFGNIERHLAHGFGFQELLANAHHTSIEKKVIYSSRKARLNRPVTSMFIR